MVDILYPKCHETFTKWLYSNDDYLKLYNKINPRIFDVSLRDGLQSVDICEQQNYTTENKLKIYKNIIEMYNPNFIEVGSIVSNKILPIMSDSIEIYDKTWKSDTNNFLLLGSVSKLSNLINHKCYNISLISSVSESFQLANTKKTLNQTKSEIFQIISKMRTDQKIQNQRIKLYLSCIDQCPIAGKIPLDFIANEIKYYTDICKPDIICLSDTCGNLSPDNFIKLLNMIDELCISCSKLSLHLHVNNDNLESVQKIFSTALDRNITEFDVSLLKTGGCSVTMGSKTKPNLSYELYYKLICDYIKKN